MRLRKAKNDPKRKANGQTGSTIAFSEQAFSDLDEIGRHIGRDSEFYDSLQINRLPYEIEIHENFPMAGRMVPEIGRRNVRELLDGSYRTYCKTCP